MHAPRRNSTTDGEILKWWPSAPMNLSRIRIVASQGLSSPTAVLETFMYSL